MPNIAAVLRDEIRRLARKEVKTSAGATKQALAQCRRDIAKLRSLVQEQQKKIGLFAARVQNGHDRRQPEDDSLAGVRYSTRSVRAQRRRLRLSAEDYGKLIGVSGLTIYNWEHSKARPRKTQIAALVAIRGIGKREALKRLAALQQQAASKRGRKK